MQRSVTSPQRGKWHVILWVLQVVLALAYVLIGISKLGSTPQAVEIFDQIGWGDWFRYVSGGLDVLVAVALLIPRLCAYGGLGVVVLAVVAIVSHLAIGAADGPMFIVPLLLGALVAWGRRDRLRLGGSPEAVSG